MKKLLFLFIFFTAWLNGRAQNPATSGEYLFLKDKRAIKANIKKVYENRLLIKSDGEYYFLDNNRLAEGKNMAQLLNEDKFKLDPNLYLKGAGKIGKNSVFLSILGSAAAVAAGIIPDLSRETRYAIAGAGLGMGIVSIGMQFTAWNRIGMAGTLQTTKNFE